MCVFIRTYLRYQEMAQKDLWPLTSQKFDDAQQQMAVPRSGKTQCLL